MQRKMYGSVISVPTNVNQIQSMLPRSRHDGATICVFFKVTFKIWIIFKIQKLGFFFWMFNKWLFNLLLIFCFFYNYETPPNFLKNSNASPKMEITKGVKVHSLACDILGIRQVCRNFGMGIKMNDKRVNFLYGPTQTKQQVG
jgi:hypothetical protein